MSLKELTGLLEQDQKAQQKKFPDQALPAVRNKSVASAIERRFKDKETLVGITSLAAHQESGLLHTVFEFNKSGAITIGANALLVVQDSGCKVVGVVDPFDLARPNPVLPPPGDMPLALSQPSAAGDFAASDDDMMASDARTQAFLMRNNIGSGAGSGSPTPYQYSVTTSSTIGYGKRVKLIGMNWRGPVYVTEVDYSRPINGADDTGVGGEAE
jgi:hypothetical protein